MYRTDLLTPLLDHISRVTRAPAYSGDYSSAARRDIGYRVLADHARMLTVCLADGILPDDNHKLRNVLRRAQTIARTAFHCESNLLAELSYKVVESLGQFYPELARNHKKVLAVLDFEEFNYQRNLERGDTYLNKFRTEYPELKTDSVSVFDSFSYYESLKCLEKELSDGDRNINGKLAFKLYESHGMEEGDVVNIASIANYSFDPQLFQEYLIEQKMKSKYTTALLQSNAESVLKLGDHFPPTNDAHKYNYTRSAAGHYTFPDIQSDVVTIVSGQGHADRLEAGARGAILTADTNFYCEAGGQVGDRGRMRSDGGSFAVEDTRREGRHVLHVGRVTEGVIRVRDQVTLRVDREHRLGCMANHTATHLLNSALNTLLPVTAQRSSFVCADYLKFDAAVFSVTCDDAMVATIEAAVRAAVEAGTAVTRDTVSAAELARHEDLITLPGENYPESVYVVGAAAHREPCCGTHLRNTADIRDFVVAGVRTPGPGLVSLRCLTGAAALAARQLGTETEEEVAELIRDVENLHSISAQQLSKRISDTLKIVSHENFPHLVGNRLKSKLGECQQTVKSHLRSNVKEIGQEAVRRAVSEQNASPYFCHYLELHGADKFNLTNALKLVPKDKPALLLVNIGKELKGKAIVPDDLASAGLTAQGWLEAVMAEAGGRVSAPRGHNPAVNCNLMAATCPRSEEELRNILERATEFAESVMMT